MASFMKSDMKLFSSMFQGLIAIIINLVFICMVKTE